MPSFDEMMKSTAVAPNSNMSTPGMTPPSPGAEVKGMSMPLSPTVNDSYLNKAVAHVNRETERGGHAPMVGGFQHDCKMR